MNFLNRGRILADAAIRVPAGAGGNTGPAPNPPSIFLMSTSDRGANTTDGITNDSSPQFAIDIDPSVTVGDSVNMYFNGVPIASHTITSGDVAANEIDLSHAPLVDNTYSVVATLTHNAAESSNSNIVTIVIRTSDRVQPVLSLDSHTDSRTIGDNITSFTQPNIVFTFTGTPATAAGDTVVLMDASHVAIANVVLSGSVSNVSIQVNNNQSIGVHTYFGYVYTNSGGFSPDSAAYSLTIIVPEVTITGNPILTGTYNVPYAGFTVTGHNGTPPYTYTIQSGAFPTGITLNSSTGVVSGTPTSNGAFTVTIRATDSGTPTPDHADLNTFTMSITSLATNTLKYWENALPIGIVANPNLTPGTIKIWDAGGAFGF